MTWRNRARNISCKGKPMSSRVKVLEKHARGVVNLQVTYGIAPRADYYQFSRLIQVYSFENGDVGDAPTTVGRHLR